MHKHSVIDEQSDLALCDECNGTGGIMNSTLKGYQWHDTVEICEKCGGEGTIKEHRLRDEDHDYDEQL